jgi:hypothetical protein
VTRSLMAVFGAFVLTGAFVLSTGAPSTAAVRQVCSSSVVSDFNGDGSADAVVGEPDRSVGGAAQAGVVHIRYGTPGHVGGGTDTTLSQADTGETAESGDRFGSVLKVGYVDRDGCADLVVGVPAEDVGSVADAGIVQVIYGSAGGLGQGTPSRVIRPGADGVPGTAAAGDAFGSAVDTPALTGIDHAVVAGAPGKDVGTATDAGQVTYVPFGGGQAVSLTQDSAGVPGTAETNDRFGASVTLGSLHGADLAIAAGAPGEAIGTLANAGSVTAMTNPSALAVTGYAITQDSDGVAGAAEAGDRFGASLSWVRPATGVPTLAVGVPGEDVGTVTDAGMVHVLDGDTLTDLTSITQDTTGVADTAEAGDGFGTTVVLGRNNGSDLRLLVGVPAEDHGTVADSGVVQEFALSGQSVTGNALIDRESLGGTSAAGDGFGTAVSYAGSALRPTWLIGAPGEDGGVVYADYTRFGPSDVPPPGQTLQTWTASGTSGFGTSTGGAVS